MFFQEHPGNTGLRGTDPPLWPGHEPAFAFESPEDLVAAAQLGMVEIHTWNSTASEILLPDRMIFDLDPGQGVTWDEVREAALLAAASRSRRARRCRLARARDSARRLGPALKQLGLG